MHTVPITTDDKTCIIDEGRKVRIQVLEEELPFCGVDRCIGRNEVIGIAVDVEGSIYDAIRDSELGSEDVD